MSGTVTDEAGLPLVGLTVFVEGTTSGATTDLDGKYSIEVSPDAVLVFSYLGYRTQTVPVGGRSRIDLQLLPDTELLTDAVVIGYGTTTKKDMTGSISAVNSDDFNSGLISSPEQLINGKVSGVQITSSGGSPTSGSTIRIRGGASLNASNDPLIVLDGVPLESGGVSGMGTNFLSLINPADIESMTVLKDASSTAIYGSRASNGVVIITTKKGKSDKLAITFNTTLSLQNKTRVPDMLSPEQFVRVATDAGYENLLGDWESNGFTDWNDRIYQTAFGTDNNLSVAGQFTRNFPFRVSLGYYNQDGIVRTDNATRYTGNINLSPSFFDDHLKITLSAKGAINKNRYAQSGQAIYNATVGDPTRPVYSGNDAFGGYSEILMNGEPVTTGAAFNPLGLLEQYENTLNTISGDIQASQDIILSNQWKLQDLAHDKAESEDFLEDYRQMLAGEGDADNTLLLQDQYNKQQVTNAENDLAAYKDSSALELDSLIQQGFSVYTNQRQSQALENIYASAQGSIVGAYNSAAKRSIASIKAFVGDDMRFNEAVEGTSIQSKAGEAMIGSYAKAMLSSRATIKANISKLDSSVKAAQIAYYDFRDEMEEAAYENQTFLDRYSSMVSMLNNAIKREQENIKNLQDTALSTIEKAESALDRVNEYESYEHDGTVDWNYGKTEWDDLENLRNEYGG